MTLRDIYYYFVAFAMMTGVIIAYMLNLDIDQKPNGRMCSIRFRTTDNLSRSREE
jgi:hypothetical protein